MTKAELIDELRKCAMEGPEESHIKADSLLLRYIDDQDIALTFAGLVKWYS